jgi:hypothetical protein
MRFGVIYTKVYPNPANDAINIEYTLPYSEHQVTLSIVNLLGQQIDNELIVDDSGTKTIDIKSWASGLYFYKVQSADTFVSSGFFIVSH